MPDHLDALGHRIEAAFAAYQRIRTAWDAKDAAEQRLSSAQAELDAKLRRRSIDPDPGTCAWLDDIKQDRMVVAPQLRNAGLTVLFTNDPDYQPVRIADLACRDAQADFDAAMWARVPDGWEGAITHVPDFVSLADIEPWLSEVLTLLRFLKERTTNEKAVIDDAARDVRNFYWILDHLRINDRPSRPAEPRGLHEAETAISDLRTWVRQRLGTSEACIRDAYAAATDVVALRRLGTMSWNRISMPFVHLDEQSLFEARTQVEWQVAELFAGAFGALAGRILNRWPTVFADEPKKPTDPPADKLFDWNGEPSYDVQDRGVVLFGTEDRFRAGLRCLLWAAVANSPTALNMVEDVQRAIKRWAVNLSTWRLAPLFERKGRSPVWRSQELPIDWAIDAAKRLADESRAKQKEMLATGRQALIALPLASGPAPPATHQDSQPQPAPPDVPQSPPPLPFSAGTMVFYEDRVELCGVDICSGRRSQTKRKILELLAKKRSDGTFVAYSSQNLADQVKAKGGQGTISGAIRDLRDDIAARLSREANVACGRPDVIESGSAGYRFCKRLTVQFDGDPVVAPITDISGERDVRNVRNGDVRNVHDEAESPENVAARRAWILERLRLGDRLQAPDVAKKFGCSLKTAQRDLQALKDAGRIEFVGAPRTGYYRVMEGTEATA